MIKYLLSPIFLLQKELQYRTLNLNMLKIFGRNNNQLFRGSHKVTYSMPQSLHLNESILKCACGFDYIAILASSGKLSFLFQAKLYQCENVPMLRDVATSQNTLIMLTKERELLAWDFDEEKVINGRINFSKIRVGLEKQDSVKKIEMGFGDIFLISQKGKLYHFKRNEWYETKSYSNIESVELSNKIIDVSSGPCMNLFISYEGNLYKSTKEDPLHLINVQTQHKFIKVATSNYNTGITKKGTIMIWGNSIHGNFREPTQFSKLTKKFLDIKLDKENGYALADDGQVWVWGVNSNGELGLSDYETRIKPFPLITLQKNHIIDIFCAHSYACCLCEPEEKTDQNLIKVIDRKITEFSTVRDETKANKYLKQKNTNNPIYIEEGHYEIKSKNVQPPIKNRRKGSNKSVEKKSHKKSSSATPSASPSPAHKRKQSKIDKNLEIKGKSKVNSQKEDKNDWLNSERDNQEDSHVQEYNRSLLSENRELKEENERLKEKVSEQADVIHDITHKIRLLEEAIDEHERSLTSRDHILQQYQSKEQVYISHINELQKTIDEIVRYKQKNNEVMVIYEDLKSNFQKQRSYYIEKIKDYEIKFHLQEDNFKKEAQELKKKLTKEAMNKENSRPWESHSPIQKKSEVPYFRGEMMGERNSINSMDQVIDQIEENKSRITKSANKLIAMLDISQ